MGSLISLLHSVDTWAVTCEVVEVRKAKYFSGEGRGHSIAAQMHFDGHHTTLGQGLYVYVGESKR